MVHSQENLSGVELAPRVTWHRGTRQPVRMAPCQPQAVLGLGAMLCTPLRELCPVGETGAETGPATPRGRGQPGGRRSLREAPDRTGAPLPSGAVGASVRRPRSESREERTNVWQSAVSTA